MFLKTCQTKETNQAKEEAAQTKETNQAKEEAAQTKETNQAKEEAAQTKETNQAKEEAAQTKETNQAKEEAAQTKETNQAKEEAAQTKETNQAKEEGVELVKLAFDILHERESSLNKNEVIELAIRLSSQKGVIANYSDLKSGLNNLLNSNVICRSLHGKDLLTTPIELKKERAIVSIGLQGKDRHRSAVKAQNGQEFIAKTAPFLNESQTMAALTVACTRDQFSLVQGSAGVGKTTMTDIVSKLHKSAGFEVKGFAQTNGASSVLGSELGVEANTIASHLYSHANLKNLPDYKNDLWIVDEASLIGNEDAVDLMRLAEKTGAKVVFLGDKDQLSGVQAGRPFELMQANGLTRANMNTIMRQKDNKELLDAVYLARDKFSSQALDKIKNSVSHGDFQSLAKEYINLSSEDRKSTLLLIPDNETRAKAMALIRVELQKKGVIDSEKEIETRVLLNKQLTAPEKSQSFIYEKNDIVEFGKDFKSIDVKKGDRYKVVGKDKDGNLRISKVVNGEADLSREKIWNPSKVAGRSKYGVEVYTEGERKFSKGDHILINKTIKSMDVKNGMRGEIVEIDERKNEIEVNLDGDLRKFNLNEFKNLDHGYAVTLHTAQGMTFKNAFMLLESNRRNLVNTRSFYVALSRAKSNVSIYTDNIKDLKSALDSRTGDKTAAHDISRIKDISLIKNRKNPKPKNVSEKLSNGFKELIDKARDKLKTTVKEKGHEASGHKDMSHGHEI
jgi:ATP-dependent exoDNAse (exonuclease V) alpha subunit